MSETIKITGIRVENGKVIEYRDFLFDDIYFVTSFRPPNSSTRILIFHTRYGEFQQVNTLDGIKNAWRDYGFLSLDTVNVVNVQAIVRIEENMDQILAFFPDGTSTTISRKKYRKLKKTLGQITGESK